MENLNISFDKTYGFINKEEIYNLKDKTKDCLQALNNKTGKGNDFLGWIDLPVEITSEQLNEINTFAGTVRNKIDIIVVIGIGGSYLGTKAVTGALSHNFESYKATHANPVVFFAGHNLSEDYMHELLEVLNDKRYGIVVISKSGTTTEPAVAFRILRRHLENKVGIKESKDLIIAVTDEKKGALRKLADDEGYRTYVIPDDIGGRYSVLTPVGLIPLAIGGFDIEALVKGARSLHMFSQPDTEFMENAASQYAAARYLLYQKGRKIEIMANFNNRLHYFAEWWKQLFGESEGKDNKGIFPASVDLTTDLHSMGQYIQQGERLMFETVISVKSSRSDLSIPVDKDNLDGLNYLAGKRIDEVNKMAELGTILAHYDGGVPGIRVEIPLINEYYLGQIIYFFEIACGISGYLLGINPFNQPGVEAYKTNMFALLEKPGYENESAKLKKRI